MHFVILFPNKPDLRSLSFVFRQPEPALIKPKRITVSGVSLRTMFKIEIFSKKKKKMFKNLVNNKRFIDSVATV